MNAKDWTHKDVWKRSGKNFLVEVSRHEVTRSAFSDHEDGMHRWCVYAYIYPNHPHFAKFEYSGGMWQDAATGLQFHGGPSYLRFHRDDAGEVTSVQIGADYNHLHDNRFTHYATRHEASEVFNDAEHLFDLLASIGG